MKEWALLGLSAGAMMLVREQDALFMLVPIFEVVARAYDAWGKKSVNADGQVAKLPKPFIGLLLMGVIAAIVFIPQLIAYKVITGNFGPSKVVSGKFNWTSPNFLNVLFSPEHGLIPWTPVFAVAIVGLALLWRRDHVLAGALALALLLQVYIAGSFLTWQSASSFGQRRFINSTLIFALGFGALVAWLVANGWPKWLLASLAALFVVWNAGLLMQYALWCSPQRQGLDWTVVLQGQLEMPGRAFGLVRDFLVDRQKFYRRTRSC
jgi:hypothetical protein